VAGFQGRQGDGGQRGGYPPQYGQQQPPGPYGNGRGNGNGRGRPNGPAPTGEPEYYAPNSGAGYNDAPGQTKAFTFGGADPYASGDPAGGDPYQRDPQAYPGGDDHVATYRAGQSATPPSGPRLHWKDLLRGIARHPNQTFWQMRDHSMWAPALLVTFIYGLLAVFGFSAARSDVLSATLSTSIPWVLTTGVAVLLSSFTLSAVTNTLARQLGGDGAWAPTIGLAMLITTLTDVPRLFFALFLGGGNSFVQLLGWLTWLACAWLLASMVSKSHDLPWLKALGASSIQLLALLTLFKLSLI
jgi:hypothetical protein